MVRTNEISAPSESRGSDLVAGGMMNVEEAAKFSGLGRSKIYELMGDGSLPSVRAGKRRLVPRNALVQYLSERLTNTTSV